MMHACVDNRKRVLHASADHGKRVLHVSAGRKNAHIDKHIRKRIITKISELEFRKSVPTSIQIRIHLLINNGERKLETIHPKIKSSNRERKILQTILSRPPKRINEATRINA